MPDVKSQIAAMMTAYESYVKGKTTGQGVSDNRKDAKGNEKTPETKPRT